MLAYVWNVIRCTLAAFYNDAWSALTVCAHSAGQGKAKGLAMIASVALGAVALGFAVLKSKK